MSLTTVNPPAKTSSAQQAAALLSVRSIAKSFGQASVLRNVSLEISQGEFLTVLGESGSGKTTLLRMIAGFEQLDSGEIWMEGERLDLLPPYRRRVNTVFQNYALFTHLSVFENVAYGLRVRKVPKSEIPPRVEQALAMVKMSAFANASPRKISGGQQQRVALARALVNRPRMLLLDEPLSALDANLRRQMQTELKALQRQLGISFVFVTHDQDEAMALSDRIALLRAGKLEQVASPRDIYKRPATAYVAQFVGQTNLLSCVFRNGMACSAALRWPCAQGSEGESALFSLRPENIRIARAGTASPQEDLVRFRARVVGQLFQGASDLFQVQTEESAMLLVRVPAGSVLEGEQEFEFNGRDVVRLRESAGEA